MEAYDKYTCTFEIFDCSRISCWAGVYEANKQMMEV